jgi:aspartate/methionine/tyrosine aminotransferase
VTDHLATLALDPAVRPRIIARTRQILNTNYPVIEGWLKSFNGAFTWTPPQAGAICFARHRAAIAGNDLVERIRKSEDVLLVPGDHFDLPGYIRFGFGNDTHELKSALDKVAHGLRPLLSD